MDNIQPNPLTPVGNQPPRPSSPPPPMPPRPQVSIPPSPSIPKPPAPPQPIKSQPQASPSFGGPTAPQPPKPFGGVQPPPARSFGEMQQSKVPPPPPTPTAEARSLKSDIESLKASGGASPKPQIIKLDELREAPVFKPETLNQMPGTVSGSSMGAKKVLKFLGGIVVVVGLGLLGYYVVYPLLFPAQEVAPAPAEPRVPAGKTEAPLSHQSLFLTAPDGEVKVNLTALTPPEIFGAIQTEALSALPAGSIKELSISGVDGQVAFADYMGALLEIGPESIRAIANDDFSGFVYYDSRGIWPGYVASLKSSASQSDAMGVLAQLESADVRRFYANDPGINDVWKDGPFKGQPVRYSSFSAPGASFNYGVVGNYVIISTSFDGLKKAVEYLGL